MLSTRSIAVAVTLALAACHRLSSDERKLVGTWESSSMDAVWRTTFKPDHTLSIAFEDDGKFGDPIPGTWRLQGSQLTTQAMFHDQPARQTITETIKFVGNDKIERTGGLPLYSR